MRAKGKHKKKTEPRSACGSALASLVCSDFLSGELRPIISVSPSHPRVHQFSLLSKKRRWPMGGQKNAGSPKYILGGLFIDTVHSFWNFRNVQKKVQKNRCLEHTTSIFSLFLSFSLSLSLF